MPSGIPMEDLTGKTFGYLTLIEKTVEKFLGTSRVYWVCRCVCGKTTRTRQDGITSGKVYSCGCKNPVHGELYGSKHPAWKGCGEIRGEHIAQYRCKAKKVGREFTVTLEWLWKLFLKQKRKCSLSGLPIQFGISRKRHLEKEQTASLDRIDSTKGYIESNVQWVHKYTNLMKKDFDQEIFIAVCNSVAKTHPMSQEKIYEVLQITNQ